jgi:hypothetical protein
MMPKNRKPLQNSAMNPFLENDYKNSLNPCDKEEQQQKRQTVKMIQTQSSLLWTCRILFLSIKPQGTATTPTSTMQKLMQKGPNPNSNSLNSTNPNKFSTTNWPIPDSHTQSRFCQCCSFQKNKIDNNKIIK